MKTIIIATLLCIATTATAGDYVNGYTRRDGTYVQGYYRSSPDSSHNNNYSTQGNYNPYTGKQGTERSTYNDNTPQNNQRTFGSPGYSDYNTNQRNPYYR